MSEQEEEPDFISAIGDFKVATTSPYYNGIGKEPKNYEYENDGVFITSKDTELGRSIRFFKSQKLSDDDFYVALIDMMEKELSISKSGIKVFSYMFKIHQENVAGENNGDPIVTIRLDYEDCRIKSEYDSRQSVYNGLVELLNKNIISRSGNKSIFFINPIFFDAPQCIENAESFIKK